MSGLRHPERRISLADLEAAIALHGSFDAAVDALDAPEELADDPPATPAIDAWYANPFHRQANGSPSRDRTTTSLWFPMEAPYAYLQTMNAGGFHDPKDYLPDPDRPMVNVHLGSTIDVGGYLSEMEAYFGAVIDALRVARWQADTIAQRMVDEAAAEGGAA